MVLVYLGSLFVLLLSAFWDTDSFTGQVQPFDWSLDAFESIATNPVYRTIAVRTVTVAVAVTVTDALLAIPIAYYMARVASRRTRRILVIAVLMPLWAAYLVKVYAWRTILQENGFLEWISRPSGSMLPAWARSSTRGWSSATSGCHTWSCRSTPASSVSLLAAGGLSGSGWPRLDDVPARDHAACLPGPRRGSDLHVLADARRLHHARLVADAKFIGNVIYDNSSLGDLPLAAAYALIPIVIMTAYLLIARRFGAFDSL